MKINLSWALWQDRDGEAEMSKAAFEEFVKILLSDKYEKEKFIKVSSFSYCQ